MRLQSLTSPVLCLTFASSLAAAQTEVITALDVQPPPGVPSSWGYLVTPMRDVTGDGVGDFIVSTSMHGTGLVGTVHSGSDGAHVYSMSAATSPLFFRQAPVLVSDPLGDGIPDIVVTGSPSLSHGSSSSWIGVFSGFDGTLRDEFATPQGVHLESTDPIALADVDGDGAEDILCSVIRGATFEMQLFSSATGLPLYTPGTQPPGQLGHARFFALEDHTGDGVRDFGLVTQNQGVRHIDIRSGADGTQFRRITPPSATRFTNNGEPIVLTDDFDGDGFGDVAMGGALTNFVEVFSSRDGAVIAQWDCAVPVTSGSTCFGGSLIAARDLDGDGLGELITQESFPFAGPHPRIFGLSPATGEIVFEQASDGTGEFGLLIAGYSGSDPLGFPTYATFNSIEDVLAIHRYVGSIGQPLCASSVNSSGAAAQISAIGSSSVQDHRLFLRMSQAPAGMAAMFIYGGASQQQPFGTGFLCVGGSQSGRLPVLAISPDGTAEQRVPLSTNGFVAGSQWTFQAIFRDTVAPGLQSSNAVTVNLIL